MKNKPCKQIGKTLVFVHDHKFIIIDEVIYSPGGLSNEVLSRYLNNYENIIVIARVIGKNESSPRYSEITNPRIRIINGGEMSDNNLNSIIKNSDGLIIRLPSILGLKAAFFALVAKKEYIIELVGNAWDAYWLHSNKGKLVAGPITLLTKAIVYFSKHVIFVTNEYLQEKYPTKGTTIGISNVYLEKLDDRVLEQRINKIQTRTSEQKLILGTIGSLDMRYKGQHHVVRAIHDLYIKGFNNIEYHLVGGGEGKYLKKLVNKLGLNHVVKFIGALPHNEVYSWLDSIDLYIQPSLTEGLPRALIEAMSRGCPCIASSAGGNPELIDKDYIFRKSNIWEITEQIVKSSIIENMIEQSYLNFKKSKQYESEHLDRQRENYIRDCLQ